MRVVAGSAGGIPLIVPKSITRPTMDKVRGAVFSSLGAAVPGSRVLDLFAGSGAYGIEALSRGATSATFVDNHRNAVEAIRSNLEKTRLVGRVQLGDVIAYLPRTSAAAFDLVFADPPYVKKDTDANFATQLLHCSSLRNALATGGTLILEVAANQGVPDAECLGWVLLRSRIYGDTAVHFLSPKP